MYRYVITSVGQGQNSVDKILLHVLRLRIQTRCMITFHIHANSNQHCISKVSVNDHYDFNSLLQRARLRYT